MSQNLAYGTDGEIIYINQKDPESIGIFHVVLLRHVVTKWTVSFLLSNNTEKDINVQMETWKNPEKPWEIFTQVNECDNKPQSPGSPASFLLKSWMCCVWKYFCIPLLCFVIQVKERGRRHRWLPQTSIPGSLWRYFGTVLPTGLACQQRRGVVCWSGCPGTHLHSPTARLPYLLPFDTFIMPLQRQPTDI